MTDKGIKIDFLDFFKTGNFDCIKLGQTQEWILQNFPAPQEKFDEEMKRYGSDIWIYGNIEFHFFDECLMTIFSDHFNHSRLNGGKNIKIKPWIFKDATQLSLQFVLMALNTNHIDYKKMTDNLGVHVRLKSGIELGFENVEDEDGLDANLFHLSYFSLGEESFRWRQESKF